MKERDLSHKQLFVRAGFIQNIQRQLFWMVLKPLRLGVLMDVSNSSKILSILASTVKTIKQTAFEKCPIPNFTLGAGVTSISSYAFNSN